MTDQTSAPARRLLVSGATGLIGRALVTARRAAGDEVVRLVRAGREPDTVLWDGGRTPLDPAVVSGFDAVVHLAGEPLVGRWTTEKKRRIIDSRVQGTTALAEAIARAEQPPAVFVSASGINFYGNRGNDVVVETDGHGSGFLAEACVVWEQSTEAAAAVSRVLQLRIGMVLAADGGALATMLPVFRLGLGGPIGGGHGFISWISLGDLVRAIGHVMESSELHGAVNVISPNPVTGRALTAALGAALHRPAVIPVPGWLVKLMMGQIADETVLGSVRAMPARLLADGFVFRDAELAEALAGLKLQG